MRNQVSLTRVWNHRRISCSQLWGPWVGVWSPHCSHGKGDEGKLHQEHWSASAAKGVSVCCTTSVILGGRVFLCHVATLCELLDRQISDICFSHSSASPSCGVWFSFLVSAESIVEESWCWSTCVTGYRIHFIYLFILYGAINCCNYARRKRCMQWISRNIIGSTVTYQ